MSVAPTETSAVETQKEHSKEAEIVTGNNLIKFIKLIIFAIKYYCNYLNVISSFKELTITFY